MIRRVMHLGVVRDDVCAEGSGIAGFLTDFSTNRGFFAQRSLLKA